MTFKTETVQSLTTAGTPQALLGAVTLARKIWLTGDSANTGNVVVFESGKTRADGMELAPGETVRLDPEDTTSYDVDKFDLATLNFDGATTGNKIRINYFL